MKILEIRDLKSYIGRAEILHSVNMDVDENEIVCVIGPNGAGKTTLLNTVSGLVSYSGTVSFLGEPMEGKTPKKIVQAGLIQCPEGRLLFPEMTVLENLEMGAYLRPRGKEVKKDLDMVFDLFPTLKDRPSQLALTLSGGEQQMLAIARALMARPKMLMLDEPSFGLAPIVRKNIFSAIEEIVKNKEVTLLLIEQNVHAAAQVANRFYVLEVGRMRFEGPTEELFQNHDLVESYLGG